MTGIDNCLSSQGKEHLAHDRLPVTIATEQNGDITEQERKLARQREQDIGQMNMYLGYFAAEENAEGDNPPIGIILSREKDELLVEYATYEMNSQLFVQKYQLHLPNKEELRRELENTLRIAEERSQQDERP